MDQHNAQILPLSARRLEMSTHDGGSVALNTQSLSFIICFYTRFLYTVSTGWLASSVHEPHTLINIWDFCLSVLLFIHLLVAINCSWESLIKQHCEHIPSTDCNVCPKHFRYEGSEDSLIKHAYMHIKAIFWDHQVNVFMWMSSSEYDDGQSLNRLH